MTEDAPISDAAWHCFVDAVCDKLETLEALELASGLEPALALTNEALTRASAALSIIEFAGPREIPGWLDGYLSNLIAVAAHAFLGALATAPPALEGPDGHRACFDGILHFAVELTEDQPQVGRVHWHLLVVQQVHKLLDAVRVLDRAGRGDEEAMAKIAHTESLGQPGEWGRMIPVLFLIVAGSVLAVTNALAAEGFTYVDDLSLQP
jgi:hypothetical protein